MHSFWRWALTLSSFVSENKAIAQIQYWLKITFVFILVLFIDSVNRVYRVQMELADSMEQAAKGGGTYVALSPRRPPPKLT